MADEEITDPDRYFPIPENTCQRSQKPFRISVCALTDASESPEITLSGKILCDYPSIHYSEGRNGLNHLFRKFPIAFNW